MADVDLRRAPRIGPHEAQPEREALRILLELRDVCQLDQMAAVAQNEPVHGEAEFARLVPAEHLDGDGEAHVVAHD